MNQFPKPDTDAVLRSLKDFQRKSVEYVFQRMYLDPDPAHRFLIADEVGLGKTMVAKGVLAKAIDHMWGQVNRIDVIYICSNADIARQNVNRLNFIKSADMDGKSEPMTNLASRITLLPMKVKNLKANPINFVSLTPATSFDLAGSLGKSEERALLYRMLKEPWNLSGNTPLHLMRGNAGFNSFRAWVNYIADYRDIEPSLQQAFNEAQAARPDLRSRFEAICPVFSPNADNPSWEQRRERARLVGELRMLLAATCLRALEPDLIILDEFQRFKNLLDGDSDATKLAQELFNYSDTQSKARVILLSATPYKMYTMQHETSDEDHYTDFRRTVQFLNNDAAKTAEFELLIERFRRLIFRISEGSRADLLHLKHQIEGALRRIMVRTERLAVSSDRNGMLIEIPPTNLALTASDVETYRSLQDVARHLEVPDTLEYWKSAPYLLNFMDDYELKKGFRKRVEDPTTHFTLCSVLNRTQGLLLNWTDVAAYRQIDPDNARIRSLISDTIGVGAWTLLWMPPTLPYYQVSRGPYADRRLDRFTKRLVFSSWQVVPKVISSILSYEAECRMIRLLEDAPENSVEARKKRRPLLRFARSTTDNRLTGMPLISLIYPCRTLADVCDPLRFHAEMKRAPEECTVESILAWARARILKLLEDLPEHSSATGPVDQAWYWAAPILLDLRSHGLETLGWFSQSDLSTRWASGTESHERAEDESAWDSHVDEARKLVRRDLRLGRPPDDLAEVLARIAIAGFGTSSLRALHRVVPENWPKDDAARMGWSFLTLFNLPEVMALIRGPSKEESERYWRLALEYCVNGNLQSVLDEYVHNLKESLGLQDKDPEVASREIALEVTQAVSLRTANLVVDEVRVEPTGSQLSLEDRRMRLRFASRLTDESGEDGKVLTRVSQVRAAFNSPFWPFILATTSVGQEGLDFHPYCHAVVHWNLPSNPVDLEQREGRVHRYKGHAVRKNLAKQFGGAVLSQLAGDPWQALLSTGSAPAPRSTLI